MSDLSLHLFGSPTLTIDGTSVHIPRRKALALLAYLAVSAQNHTRDALATLLWPQNDQSSARAELRRTLWALNRVLGKGWLQADRETVSLIPDPGNELWLDVTDFQDKLKVSEDHDHPANTACPDCLAVLEEAVELYQDDFMAGFNLKDCREYDEWQFFQSEQLGSQLANALLRLSSFYESARDYEKAIQVARRWLALDPLQEAAYRQLMALFAQSGQRSAALSIYQQCVQTLDIELGSAPSSETTALYESIQRDGTGTSDRPPQTGTIRGYEIREHLGSGHMAAVYKAYQPVIGRDVAIKVILPQLANHPDFIRRFEVEAQLVARLEHPHIVPLYDYWRDPSGAYLVMRWLKGGSLQDSLQLGPWKPDPAVRLIEQIAEALRRAHHQGVVHCDIKPANILLDEEGNAYLSDFGIATLTGTLAQLSQFSQSSIGSSSLGSLGYTSPEITRNQAPTPLADIYSLGVVIYELLTGEPPFPGIEGQVLVDKHLSEPLPSVLDLHPELPQGVDAVIQQATQKNPSVRFQDVESLAIAFRHALLPESINPPEIATTKVVDRNPYKGLRPFMEADALDFFGRDELVSRLLKRLSTGNGQLDPSRFLAVVGPSGSGKSSVVKAGLIPAVRTGAIPGSENWFVVEMTPGSHPFEELETTLLRIAIEPPEDLARQLRVDPRGLIKVLRRTLPDQDSQVLLLIDQFEELFILVENKADRDHFLEMLSEAANDPHSPLRLVITLRADFYDRPLEHSQFGELVREASEVVLPLKAQELEHAICGPANGVGVNLESALVTQIVSDVGKQPGALPLLQYALTETFEQRQDGQLTLAAYQASGGVLGALGRRAEEIYNQLGESEGELTRQLFLRMVTLGEGIEDTRRRVLRSELVSLSADQGALSKVIDIFGRYRLLTFDHDPATRTPIVEVAHDALLREWPRLRDWLDESRDDIRMQRLLGATTKEWLENNKDPGFLLRGARLDQFSVWIDDSNVALTADERAFLEVSLSARQQRKQAEAERQAHEARLEQRTRRFLQALVGVFAVAAVVAVVLSILAFNAQQSARSEANARATQQVIAEDEAQARTVAEAQAIEDRDRALEAEQEALKQASIGLASQALAEMRTANSERGVLLALAALEEYPYTPQAEAALARTVQESLPYKFMIDDNGVGLDGHWVDFSSDGQRIALGATENDAGEHAAVVFNTNAGEIDLVIPLKITEKSGVGTNERCSVQQINWSPDGTRLALVANNNNLVTPQPHCYYFQVYNAETGDLLRDFDSQGEFAVDWSPDGQLLLTGGEDGSVKLWDANSGELVLEMQGHQKTDFEILADTSDRVLAARFSPDGVYAATFSAGGILYIWEASNGELIHTFSHPSEAVGLQLNYPGMNKIALTWSPDSKRIATAWYDGLGRVWNLESKNVEQILAGHTGNMTGIDWSPDGAYLLTQGIDTSARLWVAATGQQLLNLPTNGFGNTAWSADGKLMAVPTQKGLLVWDISTLPPVINPSTPVKNIISEALWTPNGNQLVLSGIDGLLIDWSGEKSSRQIAPSDGFFAISPDSRRMVAVEGWNKTPPQIIDLQSGEVVTVLENPDREVIYFTNSWSNNGKLVASGTYPDFWTVFWDPETGQEQARSEKVEGFMKQAQFSPDDSLLAAPTMFSEGNSPVFLIDPQTGETIRKLPSEDGWSIVAYWSPDGETLAVGYQSGVIKLWDTKTWSVAKKFEAHLAAVNDLCWSLDGRRIISGDDNSLVLVWEVETGEVVMNWDMQGLLAGGFNDTDWSPDGQFVVIHGTGDVPFIKRAWQSTEDLIEYAYECCVWRELTAEERAQFGLPEK